MTAAPLTIRALRSIGVEVPMTYALGTSRGTLAKAPLLLIDLETEQGVTGRSYLWCYFPAAVPAIAKILEEVERVVKGERVAPVDLWSRLAERFALIGVQGIVRMAMSGLDVAAWDALATDPVNLRWQAEMAKYFEAVPGLQPGERFAMMKEVFYME